MSADDFEGQVLAWMKHIGERMEHLEEGLAKLRIDVMGRMDRLEARLDSLDGFWSMEKRTDAVAEDNRRLGEQINILTKIVHQLEAHIANLEQKG